MLSTLPQPLFASLSIKAPEVYDLWGFPVSNSMIAAVIVCIIIIAIASYACRQIKLIPDDDQNLWEVIVEWMLSLCEPILGEKGAQRTFWFFAAIFIFIVSANLIALLPGTGSIGYLLAPTPEAAAQAREEVSFLEVGPQTVYHPAHGDYEASGNPNVSGFVPFLRGTNADTNMVFAMAMWFMVLWFIWSIWELGFLGFLHHIFGPKASMGGKGVMGVVVAFAFGAIFLFVGAIEVVSIAFRPISLAFRLFGNIYGGEAMLDSLFLEVNAFVGPNLSWFLASLVLVPAYLFELLVAIVQALVFCLLTAAFTGIMIKHDDHHGDDDHGKEAAH